nr:hypothetical protein [Kibdelosporangium sp. MJ126-NF4]
MRPHRVVQHHCVLPDQCGLHPSQHEAIRLNLRLCRRC